MRSALRSVAVTVAASTALALVACGGDDGGTGTDTDDAPSFTTTSPQDETTTEETTGETTPFASESGAESGAPTDAKTSAGSQAPEPSPGTSAGSSGDVEVSVTAPEKGWGNIIKTGQSTYEMTGDYTSSDSRKNLPSVSWKPQGSPSNCSTVISYLAEDGTEIAQYRTTDCSSSSPEGEQSSSYEWLDRSPLPSQGSEVPLTVRVTVEDGDGETSEGETTITLRNPNNYRN